MDATLGQAEEGASSSSSRIKEDDEDEEIEDYDDEQDDDDFDEDEEDEEEEEDEENHRTVRKQRRTKGGRRKHLSAKDGIVPTSTAAAATESDDNSNNNNNNSGSSNGSSSHEATANPAPTSARSLLQAYFWPWQCRTFGFAFDKLDFAKPMKDLSVKECEEAFVQICTDSLQLFMHDEYSELERYIEQLDSLIDEEEKAAWMGLLAGELIEWGSYRDAEVLLKKSYKLFMNLRNVENTVILLRLASLYQQEDNILMAERFFEKILQIANQRPVPEAVVLDCHLGRTSGYQLRGDLDLALAYWEALLEQQDRLDKESNPTAEDSNDSTSAATAAAVALPALSSSASSSASSGSSAQASSSSSRQSRRSKKRSAKKLEKEREKDTALTYPAANSSIWFCVSQADIKTYGPLIQHKEMLLCLMYSSQGSVLVEREDYSLAASRISEALRMHKIHREKYQNVSAHFFNIHMLLIRSYGLMEKPDKAEKAAERARVTFSELYGPDSWAVGLVLQSLADIKYWMGNWEATISLCKEALKISQKTFGPVHPNVAAVYYYMGDIYAATYHLEEGARYVKRATRLMEKWESKAGASCGSVLVEYNYYLYALYFAKQDYETSLRYLEKSVKLLEQLDETLLEPDTVKSVALDSLNLELLSLRSEIATMKLSPEGKLGIEILPSALPINMNSPPHSSSGVFKPRKAANPYRTQQPVMTMPRRLKKSPNADNAFSNSNRASAVAAGGNEERRKSE